MNHEKHREIVVRGAYVFVTCGFAPDAIPRHAGSPFTGSAALSRGNFVGRPSCGMLYPKHENGKITSVRLGAAL